MFPNTYHETIDDLAQLGSRASSVSLGDRQDVMCSASIDVRNCFVVVHFDENVRASLVRARA